MQRKSILTILTIILILLPHAAYAVDLPIDIDAIGQMDDGGQRYAVTSRRNIDLFSETAESVNTAITSVHARWREEVQSGMFNEVLSSLEIDINAHILQAASQADLFAEPIRFTRATTVEEESTLSAGVISLVLLGALGVGALISWAVVNRKEQTFE